MRLAAVAAGLLAAAGAGAAAPAGYTLDPTHSFVHAELRIDGTTSVRARLPRPQGLLRFDRAAREGRLELQLDGGGADSGDAALDARLRDFLGGEAPLRLLATRFVVADGRITALGGELEWLGARRPVELQVRRFGCYPNPLFAREVCGGDLELELSRADFAAAPPPAGVDARWRLLVQVEAIREAP